MPNGASSAAVEGRDRRRCVRRKVLEVGERVPVDLGAAESGLLLDISVRGVSVQGLRPLRPGVRISLKFPLPGSEVSVQPTYEVVWADRDGRIGLKFLYMAEREQRLLDQWAAVHLPPTLEPEAPPETLPAESVESAVAFAPAAVPAMTLDEELARVVEQATAYTSADGAAVALRDERGIVCRASCGNAPGVGVLLDPHSGLSGECIRTGAVVDCTDATSDPRVDPAVARQLDLRSTLILPIKVDGAVHGLIEVLSSRAAAFTPAHRNSLDRLAEILGFLMGPPVAPEAPLIETPGVSAPIISSEPELDQSASVCASSDDTTQTFTPAAPALAEGDVAGILSLIEPELAAPTAPPVRQSAAVAPPVGRLYDEIPEPSPLSSVAPLPSRRAIIIAALVIVCFVLLAGAWLLAPRWFSSRPAAKPVPSAAIAPAVALPATAATVPTPPPAIQPAPRKASRSAAPPKAGEQGSEVVTWIMGGTRPPSAQQSTANDSNDATAPSLVGLPATASGLASMPTTTPMAPVRPPETGRPLRVTAQAMLERLVSRPEPEYPEAARRAGITGVVNLMVVIGADGKVQMAAPVSGPAVLGVAAAKAVKQWHYRPYLQNGKPVSVETTVSISFRRG